MHPNLLQQQKNLHVVSHPVLNKNSHPQPGTPFTIQNPNRIPQTSPHIKVSYCQSQRSASPLPQNPNTNSNNLLCPPGPRTPNGGMPIPSPQANYQQPVSYTHLTLPTICSV